MNWFDNHVGDTLHDTDMIFTGFVVPDRHESPRLLIKVPVCLDDPVVTSTFFVSSRLWTSACENIVPGIMSGRGIAERTALTHHSLQTGCHKTEIVRLPHEHKEGSTVLHGDRVVQSPLVQGISVPA